jgi:uncharacterized protein (TIGR03435 family)
MAVLIAHAPTHLEADRQAPSPTAPHSFEVASVKRTPPVAPGGAVSIRLGGLRGNRWSADGVTLLMLVRSAYGPRYAMQGQIVGGPSWVETDRFTVTAVADGVPTPEDAQAMLRTLLAERFKLVVREEQREMAVYALTIAGGDRKPGRQLTPVDVDCEALMEARRRGDGPPAAPPPPAPDGAAPPCSTMMMMGAQGMMRIRSGGATIAQLAQTLSSAAGRPVLDRTGLSGAFAYELEFAREPGASTPFGGPPVPLSAGPVVAGPQGVPAGGGAVNPGSPGGTPPSDLPSVFAAVDEQLGLKLEARRAPADVLVIVSAEPPTAD